MKSKFRFLPMVFIGLIVLIAAFAMQYHSFGKSSYAVGADGYYHIIQAKSFLETGKTHSPDYSFTPYSLAAVYKIVGNWEDAQKVMLSILRMLISLFAFIFVFRVSLHNGNKTYHSLFKGIIFSLLFAVSPTLTYIASQFMKQLYGIAIFFLYLIALEEVFYRLKAGDNKKLLWVATGISFVGATLSMFAHRLNGVFAFFGFPFMLNKKILLIGAATGGVLLLLGSLFVPGIIGVLEFERFKGMLSIVPVFQPVAIFRHLNFNFGWLLEMLVPYLVFVMGIIVAVRKIKTKDFNLANLRWYFLFLLMIGIFPFYKFTSLDMGFRLFIIVIPIAYLLSFYLLNSLEKKRDKAFLIPMIFALTMLPFNLSLYNPTNELPYKSYDTVISKVEAKIQTLSAPPEILIVHHGFSFYYTYITDRHTLPFVPEWDYSPTNVYRLVYGISDAELQYFLPPNTQEMPSRLNKDYILFREDVWASFVEKCKDDSDMRVKVFSMKNPFSKRPKFMQKFKGN